MSLTDHSVSPSASTVSIALFRLLGGSTERVTTYEEDLLGLLNQLDLDEIDELYTFFAHRMQNGHPSSDHDLAMIHLLEQVRGLAGINEDWILARRIADGDDVGTSTEGSADVPESEESIEGEEVVVEAEGNDHRQQSAWTVRNRIARFLPRRRWISSLISQLFSSKPFLARRAPAVLRKRPTICRPTGHSCVVCQDLINGVEIRAPCGHYFDIDCMTQLFQSATRDETLFPPRCCGESIPFTRVRSHLSRTLVTIFRHKQVEFGTLKRVYCSSPTCSRFLGPLADGLFGSAKVYTCPAPECRARTCGKCREPHASEHVCRPDAGASEVLALGRTSGWSRCPGCAHMIELHVGCFHTTCRCRTEFCYLCRAPWKTCDCPQWYEQRLIVEEEESDNE